MKNELRIVFMGTPGFAVASLKALIDSGHNVVGVITAPDRPAGRGRKMQMSEVKTYALSQHLNVLQPTNLKDETFIKTLKALNANLQIVVAFRMLPEAVWRLPKYGTFNLHASLLPEYRGAAPIHWAIIHGETETGVTTFFIDDKIDTGEIILQKTTDIADDATVGMLHDKLMALGSDLVLETVKRIANGTVSTTAQPNTGIEKSAPKLHKDNCKIDWNDSLEAVYNKIRGLNPFPAAWCYLENGGTTLPVKLYDVEKEAGKHSDPPGHLEISKQALKVSVQGGYIHIKTMQLPGKRNLDIPSLLNGYQFSPGANMR